MSPPTATAVHSYLQSVQPTEFLKLSICRVGVDQQSHSARSTTLHIICAGASLSIPGTNCPLCVSTAWGCLCGKVRAVTHFPSCLLHTCVSCWRLQITCVGHASPPEVVFCLLRWIAASPHFFGTCNVDCMIRDTLTLHNRPSAYVCEAWAQPGLWQFT